MKVFVLILQKPLKVLSYTSLSALYNDNKAIIDVSKSTLDHHDFDRFHYLSNRFIIAKTDTQTTGDIKRKQTTATKSQK